MRFRRVFLATAAAAASMTAAAPALAQACSLAGASWCYDTGATAVSAPMGFTSEGLAQTWLAAGGTLYTFNSGTGSLLGTTASLGTISNRPMAIKLPSGTYATFSASNNGYVYRVDQNGNCLWQSYVGRTSATTIDGACGGAVVSDCPSDEVTGTPAIISGASDAATLIVVGTRYQTTGGGCSTTARNRVYALRATDGYPVWVFNSPGGGTPYADLPSPYNMSYIAGGVFPDVWDDGCGTGNRNQLYIGSNAAGGQDTAWGLDSATGAYKWSYNLGGIQSIATLAYNNTNRCGRIYLGTTSGTVGAYGLTTTACGGAAAPCAIWTTNTVGSGAVRLNPALMQYGANKGGLWITSGNTLQKFTDAGASGTLACSYAGVGSTQSAPALTESYVYVGDNKGNINEVDQSSCALVSAKLVEPATTVGNAALDANAAFTTPFIVVGTSAGRIARFDVPW